MKTVWENITKKNFREKNIKIEGKIYPSILMAGGKDFKIYSVNSKDAWILVNKKPILVNLETPEYKIIQKYVMLKYYPAKDAAEIIKNFLELLEKQKTMRNGIFKSNAKTAWEKLIKPHAPIEENGEYVFDNHSSGIYTPVLEGVSRLNPPKFKDSYYIKIASNLELLGDKALNNKQYEIALRGYSQALITAMIGAHVNYYNKVKKLEVKPDSKKINDLLKASDADIMYIIIRLCNKRFNLKKEMLDRGNVDLVTRVEKDFNLYRSPDSSVKNVKNFYKRST